MTIQKSFVKRSLMLLCLLILAFDASHVVNGQKQQPEQKPDTIDKYVIIDGDIQVSPSFYQELLAVARSPQSAPIKYPTRLWPNGIVPFQFETTCAATSTCTGALLSGCVSAANQTAMLNAMAELETAANVDFQQCANNRCSGNYVHIRDSTNDTTVGPNNTCENNAANNSAIGVKGGRQVLNTFRWGVKFAMAHELLHCLGFFHEHSRPDRDTYVRPICENVRKGGCNSDRYKTDFTIKDDATAYGYYDFDSVMHYSQCNVSANNNCPNITTEFPDGGITLLVREPYNIEWQTKIGQRTHLSDLDRATLSFLYPPSDWRFLDISYNGGNGSPNGSFYRPYTSFEDAVTNTPAGGTIWLLRTQTIPAIGAYSKLITVKAAPGVVATLGG